MEGKEKLRSDFQNTRRGQSSCYGGCRSDGESELSDGNYIFFI